MKALFIHKYRATPLRHLLCRYPEEAPRQRLEMNMSQSKLAMRAVGLLFSLLMVSPAFGEPDEHEPVSGHETTHDYHKNVISGFIGITGETRRENGTTFGLEYFRRVNRTFSIGAVVERASGDLDFWVYAMPFAFHTGRWKFFVAPGIEDSDHHGSEFLVRVGGEYAFEVGSWEIAPQLSIDFVNGEELGVLGIAIGKGF